MGNKNRRRKLNKIEERSRITKKGSRRKTKIRGCGESKKRL